MDVFNNYIEVLDKYMENHENDIISIGRPRDNNFVLLNFIPSGFDIETTTQYTKDERGKVITHYTNMYIWQFGFDYINFFGRTWRDFSNLLNAIKNACLKKQNLKFLFFIHNAGFESAFMLRELEELGHTIKIFAREKRHPIKVEIDDKFIILDSSLLTGYSLEVLAKNYTKTQKLKGDLDYTILRNSLTPISNEETNKNGISAKELSYCRNDIRILVEYAEVYRERYLADGFLPMTAIMIASRHIKLKIKELGVYKDKYFFIQKCYPNNQKQYDYIMTYYTGAYTHGMLKNLFITHKNVLAYDVTSEYPFALMNYYYPMSQFKPIPKRVLNNEESMQKYLNNYCCLIECTFENMRTKTGVTILSKNKITTEGKAVFDNGRLWECVNGGKVTARLTEIDIQTLNLHYDWDTLTFSHGLYCKRGLLPKYYRLTIAELYANKSNLKGVEGMEVEYMQSKKDLNGQYGALVTQLNTTEIYYNKGWKEEPHENDFTKIKRSKNTIPQWGIYCTSWSRFLILSTIAKLPMNNYLYSDTDSIKQIYSKKAVKVFDDINAEIRKNNQIWIKELKLDKLYPNVDFSEMGTFTNETMDKNGNITPLKRFKTLGAKRYLVEEHNGTIAETVAGLPKHSFTNYCKLRNLDPFDTFTEDGLTIAEEETKKLCTYYEDNRKTFEVTDYLGNTETVTAESYVSLIPTTFNLKVSKDLTGLKKLVYKKTGRKQ